MQKVLRDIRNMLKLKEKKTRFIIKMIISEDIFNGLFVN